MIGGHPESLILYKLRFEKQSDIGVLNGRWLDPGKSRYETFVKQLASVGLVAKALNGDLRHWGAPWRIHIYPADERKLTSEEASQVEGTFRLVASNNSLVYAHEMRIRVKEESGGGKDMVDLENPPVQLKLL